jgi:Putative mono-oxygenase ydhR
MHAVVVKVTIEDFETARKNLRAQVVPAVSQAPGFVAGYWTASEDRNNGIGMILFDSEESARTASEMIAAGAREGVTLDGVEIREVVEHA